MSRGQLPAKDRRTAAATSLWFYQLTLLVCMSTVLPGCSDFIAYNFRSTPQQLKLIPEKKLETQWHLWKQRKDEIDASVLASLSDEDWGAAFDELASQYYGWRPDFCRMYEARTRNHIDIHFHNGMKKEFWLSYIRNVYYDVMLNTPTLKDKSDNPHAPEKCEEATIACNIKKVLEIERPFKSQPDKANQLPQLLKVIQNTPPACPSDSPAPPTSHASTPSKDSVTPVVSHAFLNRLLKQIDEDHSELLLGEDKFLDDRFEFHKLAWLKKEEADRTLTVSRERAASISPSVRRAEQAPAQAAGTKSDNEGQQELIEYLGKLQVAFSAIPKCDGLRSLEDIRACTAERSEQFKKLWESVKRAEPDKESDPDAFNPFQTFELTLSSVLNSPDVVNRIDYLTTYLYFYQFPYPSNADVQLEDEYWQRFMAYHYLRHKEEDSLSLAGDLDAAWNAMRVEIDKINTTVAYAPLQEIAQVTRAAGQTVEIKPQPTVNLAGTIQGKVETPITLTSDVKTTVTEKLMKELDRRSTWIYPNRNMLRITQRGMEAINVAGSFKDEVTLKIPASYQQRYVLDFEEQGDAGPKQLTLRALKQPLYSSVGAFIISLAVVREPYHFKRSASEKFGLADSADSYYIVSVAKPTVLPLWHWNRMIYQLDTDDIDFKDFKLAQPQTNKVKYSLQFWSPARNAEGLFGLSIVHADSLVSALRARLQDLLKSDPSTAGPRDQLHPSFKVQCYRVARQQPAGSSATDIFLVMQINEKGSEIDKLWIGKSVEGKLKPFEGNENEYLEQLNTSTRCISPPP
jgi:hypothetical protein